MIWPGGVGFVSVAAKAHGDVRAGILHREPFDRELTRALAWRPAEDAEHRSLREQIVDDQRRVGGGTAFASVSHTLVLIIVTRVAATLVLVIVHIQSTGWHVDLETIEGDLP